VQVVRIEVPGDPVAWARPRMNKGKAFTAERQREARSSLSWQIAMGWGRPKVERKKALGMTIEFVFKARRKSDLGMLRVARPDLDNLVKLVMDAAQDIVFEDDAQIAELTVIKRWGEVSQTNIEVNVQE